MIINFFLFIISVLFHIHNIHNNRDPSIIWEGHFAGIGLGYFQMEKLTYLDKVPPVGATIYSFPMKIARASAGWVRAVATIPD